MSRVLAGRYRMVRRLGAGGAGEVFEVQDLAAAGRRVAVKVGRAGDPAAAASLLAELRVLRQLHVAAVPRALDFASVDGRPFLVRTLVEGEPIDQARRGWSALAPLARALFVAVRALHRRGWVHGDLKGDNVLVADDRVALIDLGLAARAGAVRAAVGTPGHIAPEVLDGGAATPGADQYALAVVLDRSLVTAGRPAHVREALSCARRTVPTERFADVSAFWEALRGPDPEVPALGDDPPPGELPLAGREVVVGDAVGRLSVPGASLALVGPAQVGRTRLAREIGWALQARGASFSSVSAAEGTVAILAAAGATAHESRESVDAPSLAARIAAALSERAAGASPAVLHLDDLDRAPAFALDVAVHLARSLGPDHAFGLLVSGRPGAWTERLQAVPCVHLGPLSARDADALLHAAGIQDAQRRSDLLALCPALPGALEEAAHGAAASIDERVERRLAALDPGPRQALAALAFAGGSLPIDCLGAGLGRLEEDGLVEVAAPGRVRIANALFGSRLATSLEARDAAAELLGASTRAEARDRLVLGRALALRGDPRAPEILLEAAGALVLVDPGAVLDAATAALQALVPEDPRRAPALELAIRASLDLGDAGAAARLAHDPDAPPLAAATALLRAGDDEAAHAAHERALAAAGDPETQARVRLERARLAQRRGRAPEAAREAEAGLAILGASVATRTALLLARGLALGAQGRDEDALAAADAALAAAEGGTDPSGVARAQNHRAIALLRLGRRAESLAAHRAAARAAEAAGVGASGRATYALNLGAALYHVWHLEEAERETLRALRLAREAGRAATESSARQNLASIYVARGQADRAAEQLAALAAGEAERPEGVVATSALTVAGDVARMRGDLAAARARYREAASAHARTGRRREAAEALSRAASLELDDGQKDAARALLAEAGDAAALGDQAVAIALVRGRLERLEGRDPRATLEPLRSIDQPDMAWEAAYELGLYHQGQQAPRLAAEHFERAAIILERAASDLPADVAERFWAVGRRAEAHAAASAEAPRPATPRGSTVAQPPDLRAFRLLALNARIAAEHDVDRILEAGIDTAVDVLDAERGFLLVPSGDALEVRVARNIDREAIVGPQLKWSRNIAEEVFRTREPIVTVDALADGRLAHAASVHAMRLRSIVCLPVVAAQRAEGVLYIDNRFRVGAFDDDAVRLARALADQLAVALVNARLIGDLRTRTRELEAAQAAVQRLLEAERARAATRESLLEDVSAKLADARRDLDARYTRTEIVGRSRAMRRVFDLLDRVIPTDVTVVLTGESGTGKEKIARAVHALGPRKDGRFVAVNCAAIPEALLESELFGHVRGAFSGAVTAREGLFVAAHKGTLLLDEVSDMPAPMQVKLLRVLQDGEVRPVGGTTARRVDVRVIAATQHPLEALVADGRFREDLLYRLRVVGIDLPPLRDRPEDLPELVEHFLGALSRRRGRRLTLSEDANRALVSHAWPGNVRELENVLERAAVLARDDRVDAQDLALGAPERPAAPRPRRAGRRRHLGAEEIRAALEAERGHRERAAHRLGVSRVTLFRRLKDLGLT